MKIRDRALGIVAGSALTGTVLMVSSSLANAACTDPSVVYIGSICTTAANFCPRGYLEAAGQIMAVTDNTALFSLLGDMYGGDGRTNFALPDLRGRSAIGAGTGPGLTPVMQGTRRGMEYVTMSVAQMPTHSHTAIFTPEGGGGGTVTVNIPVSGNTEGNKTTPDADYSYLAASPAAPDRDAAGIWSNTMSQVATVKGVTTSGGGGGGGTVTIGTTGGSQPLPNVPPQLGLKYCIATQGLYPPRP